jgi:hypothetical protein
VDLDVGARRGDGGVVGVAVAGRRIRSEKRALHGRADLMRGIAGDFHTTTWVL